ncbi:hypothetical protein [Sphingobacterium multivorum]|uniref:hypothetical protein n=2 Tax=Sphingobacteriaceae TaxID=84566 RepID=UPI00289DA0AB|nr:hypothetical protein [Sphingobacterium multivorum]
MQFYMKELIDKHVLIHPLLPIDPAQKQGHLGTISYASYDNEIMEVSFEDGEKSLYLTDALLVFKSIRELSQTIKEQQLLTEKNLKTFMDVYLILKNEGRSQVPKAFHMILSNNQILSLATVSLTSRLELTLPEDMHPYWQKGPKR